MTKCILGQKALIYLSISREVRAGTNGADDKEECCLWACYLWLTQPASYTTQDHFPRGGINQ